MNTIIIHSSKHHGNTKKIAQAMATVPDAKVVNLNENDRLSLADYKLVGFSSGIYVGKHDKKLLALVAMLPPVTEKKAFVFSKSGLREGHFINNFNR